MNAQSYDYFNGEDFGRSNQISNSSDLRRALRDWHEALSVLNLCK